MTATELPAIDIAAGIATEIATIQPARPSEALQKVADIAEAATTAAHADNVAAETSAAMSNFYSSALHALANVKVQIANLEEALELRRLEALNEIQQFTKATAETFNMAAVLSRTLANIEKHTGLPPRAR